MAVPARDTGAVLPGIGGQQLFQDAAAQFQQPGPEYLLRGLQAGIAAVQRPGGFRGQPS
ncbi:MAG TPA: hypothetical protein VFQ68_32665 [Streptosporangiaceae bacterium]|nr:hypothetical protein [Streptosporangiaceae bacterium]